MVTSAVITGFGVATPPSVVQTEVWDGFFAAHSDGSERAKHIFTGAGVDARHGVANPMVEDVSQWSTAERMKRYEIESLPLGESALTQALTEAGLTARDLGLLAVVSCTGYATPGLDIALADRLGAAPDTQRVVIGHMGCYAAIPGMRTVADYVRLNNRPAALLCVELTTLHLQPGPLSTEQIVAHALFSDAAAAIVVSPGPATGLEIIDVISRTDTKHAGAMTWHVTDQGFRMGLSSRVPLVLARHLPDTVTSLLRRHELEIGDIDAWAIHPGGRKILDVAQKVLSLSDEDLDVSRETLRQHGNCSSATILMILRQLAGTRPSETAALAFGPGLTLYGALLRHTG